jgi:hypothetical protein
LFGDQGTGRLILVHVDIHDIGWSYGIENHTRVVMIDDVDGMDCCPPADLLKPENAFILDIDDPLYKEYEGKLISKVKESIDNQTIIVLPEVSTCEALEEKLKEELDNRGADCIIIAGSYYRKKDIQRNRTRTVVNHIAPILISNGPTYYQHKFKPSRFETKNKIAYAPNNGSIHVFKNTGFCDFAALICSDGLPENNQDSMDALRSHIDLLAVPASIPKDQALPTTLEDLCRWRGFFVAFCNGFGDSKLFTPYTDESELAGELSYELDLLELDKFIAGEQKRK